jgi:hypothetical protein
MDHQYRTLRAPKLLPPPQALETKAVKVDDCDKLACCTAAPAMLTTSPGESTTVVEA